MRRGTRNAAGIGLVLAVLTPCFGGGSVTILSRTSHAINKVFAGSGGAVQQSEISDTTSALTGPFSFSDSAAVVVTEKDPFSNGSADAEGTLIATDSLVQSGPRTITLTAVRVSDGEANHGSGTGNGQSRQNHRVHFTVDVIDTPVQYQLTGDFNPGVESGPAFVELRRPFTANVQFYVDTAGPLNESGTLLPGRSYRFELRLEDDILASAGTPTRVAASSADLQFTISPIPCTGDVDGDGDTDLTDLASLLTNFGCSNAPCEGDLDESGTTDLSDLAILLGNFGCS